MCCLFIIPNDHAIVRLPPGASHPFVRFLRKLLWDWPQAAPRNPHVRRRVPAMIAAVVTVTLKRTMTKTPVIRWFNSKGFLKALFKGPLKGF